MAVTSAERRSWAPLAPEDLFVSTPDSRKVRFSATTARLFSKSHFFRNFYLNFALAQRRPRDPNRNLADGYPRLGEGLGRTNVQDKYVSSRCKTDAGP